MGSAIVMPAASRSSKHSACRVGAKPAGRRVGVFRDVATETRPTTQLAPDTEMGGLRLSTRNPTRSWLIPHAEAMVCATFSRDAGVGQ